MTLDLEGTHTFAAPMALVWSYLHNPEIIARVVPNCEKFEQISADEFLGLINILEGPFKGNYEGTIHLIDSPNQQEYSLNFSGSGPEGSIYGKGRISLSEQHGHTILNYEGELDVGGKTASDSPRLLRTTANSLIRQFLVEVDRYIQIQTGIYTTETVEHASKKRKSGTIDMADVIEEVKQDRQTTKIVLIFIILATLMSFGGVAIVIILTRWAIRLFRQFISSATQTEEEKNTPGSLRVF